MKVLMLSTDKNIFINGSEVQQRMVDYGGLVEELYIIVKVKKSKFENQKLGNIFIYPTNDKWKFLYFINAYRIGKSIIRNWVDIKNCVITCQDPFETGLVGCFLKSRFNIPLQIQIHTDFLSPYFFRESFKNKGRVILGKKLVGLADGLRVVSDRIRRSLLELKPKVEDYKIIVLPITVDVWKISNTPITTDLHKKYSQFNCIILMASRLTKEKNVGLAIKAMEEVVTKYPKTLLLIVGNGPEFSDLKLQVINHRLQDFIFFEPWTDDLFSYYKTADLFLLTSNYEGGARSPAEAVASCLAVIMTDVAPAHETIIDDVNGFVVPVGDSKVLAQKMMVLIGNRSKRDRFANESQKITRNFITKKGYLEKYRMALEGLIKR